MAPKVDRKALALTPTPSPPNPHRHLNPHPQPTPSTYTLTLALTRQCVTLSTDCHLVAYRFPIDCLSLPTDCLLIAAQVCDLVSLEAIASEAGGAVDFDLVRRRGLWFRGEGVRG
eukprot:7387659-Prymnesium_polylepis.2